MDITIQYSSRNRHIHGDTFGFKSGTETKLNVPSQNTSNGDTKSVGRGSVDQIEMTKPKASNKIEYLIRANILVNNCSI